MANILSIFFSRKMFLLFVLLLCFILSFEKGKFDKLFLFVGFYLFVLSLLNNLTRETPLNLIWWSLRHAVRYKHPLIFALCKFDKNFLWDNCKTQFETIETTFLRLGLDGLLSGLKTFREGTQNCYFQTNVFFSKWTGGLHLERKK